MNKDEKRRLYSQEYYKKHKEKINERTVAWQKNNKEKLATWHKIYYQKNRDKIVQKQREWNKANRERVKTHRDTYRKTEKYREYLKRNIERNRVQAREYHQKHREESLRRSREHYLKNKVERIEKQKRYDKSHRKEIQDSCNERRKKNIQYRLSTTLRSRIVSSLRENLRGRGKAGSAVRDLGCTIPELKLYLEERFQEGMTWNNWTTDGWHIDHDIPLAFFDLTNRKQFLSACHYTNLQPMWAEENFKKKKYLDNFLENRLLDKWKEGD